MASMVHLKSVNVIFEPSSHTASGLMFIVNVIVPPVPDAAPLVSVPPAVVSVTAAVVSGADEAAAAVVPGAAAVSLELPLSSLPQAAATRASPTASAA